jgi:hypothetical protein
MDTLIFKKTTEEAISKYLISQQVSQLVKDKASLEQQVINLLTKVQTLELENKLLKNNA